jgi:hypothetical protein
MGKLDSGYMEKKRARKETVPIIDSLSPYFFKNNEFLEIPFQETFIRWFHETNEAKIL